MSTATATATSPVTRNSLPTASATQREISADFPFESKYVDVLDSNMHYIDEGEGETILFLHGNPTSSYLWRNVIPHVSGQARCIAVDLIGMGKSGHPDSDYTYDDQYRYLSAFIEKQGIGENLTLVIHDWGSGLGFRWAADHPDQVRAIAFMEAMVRPMSYADLPGSLKVAMRIMRSEPFNYLMVGGLNMFIEKMLPDLTYNTMSPDVLAEYRSYYPTVASRKAVRQWPKEVPFDGAPARNYATITGYLDWLQQSDIPKLMLHGDDGVAIKAPELEWCRTKLSNIEIVDLGHGKHFVQETNPHGIGEALSDWYARL